MGQISTFGHFGSPLSALQAAQQAMDITSHNIANANTEGYSRQDIVLAARPGGAATMAGKGNTPGMGVDVLAYRRVRQVFVDTQLSTQLGIQEDAQAQANGLEQIEGVFPEPSDQGLQNLINRYFQSWHDLAGAPTDPAARKAVLLRGAALADTFRATSQQLTTIASQANGEITNELADVNSIAQKLQAVNQGIKDSLAVGGTPNDLFDQRDLMLDKLAEYANVTVTKSDQTGALDVTFGGFALITSGVAATVTEAGMTSLSAGSLHGEQQLRDVIVPGYQAQLDGIATAIITEVNNQHQAGKDVAGNPGLAFFTGTDATDITLNPALVNAPDLVAASSDGTSGNTDNALALAGLVSKPNTVGATETISGAYRDLVTTIGAESKDDQRKLQNASSLVDTLRNRRDSVSGVSMDEEMANLIKYQHAYSAAARSLNAIDDMLNKLINSTGRVGI